MSDDSTYIFYETIMSTTSVYSLFGTSYFTNPFLYIHSILNFTWDLLPILNLFLSS